MQMLRGNREVRENQQMTVSKNRQVKSYFEILGLTRRLWSPVNQRKFGVKYNSLYVEWKFMEAKMHKHRFSSFFAIFGDG
jgi:hypothetical protein